MKNNVLFGGVSSVVWFAICALILTSSSTVFASGSNGSGSAGTGDFVAEMWDNGVGYSGPMTHAKVLFWDASGALSGDCIPTASVTSSGGWVDFDCDFFGSTSGLQLVELTSDEVTELFYVASAGSDTFLLNSVTGDKQGTVVFDLGENGPEY